MKLILLSFTVAALLTGNSVVSGTDLFKCLVGGPQFVGSLQADISYACCKDTQELREKDGSILSNDLEDCDEDIYNEITSAAGMDKHCNTDHSYCTIDFQTFPCESNWIRTCGIVGGENVHGDVERSCTNPSDGSPTIFNVLNYGTCISSTCSAKEMINIYQTMVQDGLGSGDCSVSKITDIRKGEALIIVNANAENAFTDDDNAGAIIGGVVGGILAILLAAALIFLFLRSKKKVKEEDIPMAQVINVQMGDEKPEKAKDPEPKILNITEEQEQMHDGTTKTTKTTNYIDGTKEATTYID